MINFGIIGTNWITHSFVAGAHATGKWNLAAVYSRKTETAEEFASQYEGQTITTYTDLEALAADPTITTVYIASPNILHYTHAKLILAAGKNVILEKPACSTVAELDDLFQTSKANNVILLEAFRHLQEPNFKLLKQHIPTLGPLYGASFTFAQYSSRYEKVLAGETPNIFNLAMGGGALVDLGVYPLAAAIDLFGAPTQSSYSPIKIATGADGAGTLLLTYPTFAVHLMHSKIFNSAAPSEIYGQRGTLSMPSVADIETVTYWDAKSKQVQVLEGVQERERLSLRHEAEEFARVLGERDEREVERLGRVSREVVAVLERVRRENGLLFPGGI
ncbi:hypothetical protein IAQ61_007491 [Plenodomus lingam]|uniref:Similar to oxidoreductase n=1 Tax=Leptosphaeria maculans (strain JN3 / isolate v23.1.3 / race Av1-4-5-6-7-8) TaxID=985895 RepID=E5A5J9_LEPMJ|nr:similar to oxidoreductase [Plenodomus lingam JN3]KAH9866902.1 hypothetical protein IAQ61_007491 [Plenodomus lingam]CBX98897.1 similar to oxidoreductase [Plenodomus lingam JN3]